MENLYLKHGLVSRTYYEKSLIMASTFGSKSKYFMTMSIPSQDEPLTNQSVWNDPRDFAKPVKAITLPQDVPSTSDCRIIKLENQVRIESTLPSDTVKNPKLSTSLVSSARSYPTTNEEGEKDNPENIHVNPSVPPDPSISFITKKVLNLNSFFESLGLVPQSSNTELVCTRGDDNDVMFIEIVKTNNDSHEEEPDVGE
ncbi:hypothetical protein Tco_1248740 [Tanacetum coccineum]